MVKKKNKPTKKGRKRALKEDVHATTSLPPSVEGQLRCFLRVSVSKIVWLSTKPPDTTHIRLRWWGEITEGSIFRPLDVKNPQKTTTRTVARYPVRCGPKQFAAYLSDMGTLLLDVLKGPTMQPIGKAQINEIGHLAPQVPVNGFYSVFSSKSADKIAELHVSLVFEPLPAAYDSSSSIPTTDLSVATAGTGTTAESGSIQSQPVRTGPPLPVPRPRRVISSSSEDPFMSPILKVPHHPRHTEPKQTITPRGIDTDYSFVVGPGKMATSSDKKKEKATAEAEGSLVAGLTAYEAGRGHSSDADYTRPGASEVETLLGTNREVTRTEHSEPAPVRWQHQLDPSSLPGSDLISALLDRGTRLRDNMIRSELDRGTSTVKGTVDERVSQGYLLTGSMDTRPLKRRSSGELFREILRNDDAHKPVLDAPTQEKENCFENSNTDVQTVELLIGDQFSTRELNDLKTLQSELSPQSSISSEGGVLSETEDPLRDQSILEELFYKGVRSSSDSSLSDLLSSDGDDDIKKHKESSSRRRRRRWSFESSLSDPGNQRPSSRKNKDHPEPSSDNTPVKDPNNRSTAQRTQDQMDGRQPDKERVSGKARRGRQRSGDGSMSEVASSESDAGSTSRMSEGSRVSFQEPLVTEKQASPGDGLSVQRLTLLGRIHIARVMINSLTLKAAPYPPLGISTEDRRPSRGGQGRGRPPRPSPKPKKKKCTYFVEYHFPVAASPREQSLVTNMATEVMRLVSKKVDSKGEVTFSHRSVFPVHFDGMAVDSWWKQLLVFKIFSRAAGQKSPVLLGVASLPLRSVLQSPDLSLLNLELDAKDKKQSGTSSNTGAESSTDGTRNDSVIGTLTVSIELASDGKDFPTALARMKIAEMKGANIIPLPSNQPHLPIKIPTGFMDSDSKSSSRSVQTDSVTAQAVDSTSSGVDGPQTSTRHHTEGGHACNENNQGHPSTKQAQRVGGRHQEQPTIGKRMDEEIGFKQQDNRPTTATTKTDYEARTLHSLLLIPEGRAVTVHGVAPLKSSSSIPHTPPQPHPGHGFGISGLGGGRDQTTRNTYLVCRLFWSDDSVRSNVCWGTTEPDYNFMQASPVLLSPSLLERARNNCMVIEVWDKKTSAQNDQLVGIAKLPLHQFYMSFRDERITSTLLKSQYPVAAVDNYVSIVDPFTGVQYGQLKVLLALGSSEQISALQRLKCDKDAVDTRPVRPGHYLERGEAVANNVQDQESSKEELVEHIFEVVVEGVRGLPQLEDTVWGEADCFVQYHFPSQSQPRRQPDGITTMSVGPILTPHQTPTTLCMPDPTFHDVSRHRLQLPRGTPVQRELLTACAGVGGGAGGIPFEVWCRYYYPNIRDQVVAKTSLPLAKLCAMVTLQRRGEPSIQTFSLPLRLLHPDQESLTTEQIAKLQDAGLLDVTINYRHNAVQDSIPRTVREMVGPQVCLSVGILRACGLKSAAKSLARYDSSLQYASEVGVNAYIKMELSFLSKQDVRITQTVARTFSPEFSHHVDFPCPLLFEERESDHLSLAEALETAEMTLQAWHQNPGFKSGHDANFITVESDMKPGAGMSARRLFAPAGDISLGTITVPLHSLLSRKTGLHGWYPLSTPTHGWAARTPAHPSNHPSSSESPKATGVHGLERVGGGLELSIKFAHQGDRDRVIDAGRRVGWSPDAELEGMEEPWDDEDGATGSHSADINVHVDSAWFPAHTALRPGQHALDSAAKAYVRYKLYDKGSVCSKLCYLDVTEENYIAADLKHSRLFQAALTQPLAWYLREERLEIQVWVSYNRELSETDTGHARPRQRDKLIGCAYIDMSALCDRRIKQHRISGLYPLFRPGASDLGGSCVRVHLGLKHVHSGSHHQQESSDEVEFQMEDGERGVRPSHHRHLPPSHTSHHQGEDANTEVAARRIEDERRWEDEKEEKERRRSLEPVLMGVAVERAMHLASVPCSKKLEDCSPSCYVTFQSAVGSPIHTSTVPNSDQPVWGFEQEVKISSDVLDRQSFIFKVWHQTSSEPDMNSDRMLGFASVDLAPLLAGFRSLNGWYNILDFSGHCQGQIKVSITPKESMSPLKRSPKPKTTPNTSAVFAQAFPHVQFTALPHHQPSQPSPPKSTHHYQEHLQNVRKFHADLHDRLRARQQDATTVEQGGDREREFKAVPAIGLEGPLPSNVSGSFLMQNLRKNLEELDTVYHGLQQRLASHDPLRENLGHHENKQSNEPSHEPLERILGNQDNDENSHKDAQCDSHGSMSLPGGSMCRRTSDEDILQKVRDKLRQEDAEYNSDDVDGDGDGAGRPMQHRYSESDEAASLILESDWEDSVQFQDGRDDKDSEQYKDVIIPKPLNDVSSACFSNGIRPDAVFTRESQNDNQGSSKGASKGNTIQQSDDDDDDARSERVRPQIPDKREDEHSHTHDSSGIDSLASGQELHSESGFNNKGWSGIDSRKFPTESKARTGDAGEDAVESRYNNDRLNLGEGINRQDIDDVISDANSHMISDRRTQKSDRAHTEDDDQMMASTQAVSNTKVLNKNLDENCKTDTDFDRDPSVEAKTQQESSEDFKQTQVDSRQRVDTNHLWITEDKEMDRTMNRNFERQSVATSSVNSDPKAGRGSDEKSHVGRRDGGSLGSSSDESVVITINSRQAEEQTLAGTREEQSDTAKHASTKSPPVQLPNFFLPARDLEASMRALHNVTSILPRSQPRQMEDDHVSTSKPTDTAREPTRRLASRHSSPKPRATRLPQNLPTAGEARRIAKIFASRYTEH